MIEQLRGVRCLDLSRTSWPADLGTGGGACRKGGPLPDTVRSCPVSASNFERPGADGLRSASTHGRSFSIKEPGATSPVRGGVQVAMANAAGRRFSLVGCRMGGTGQSAYAWFSRGPHRPIPCWPGGACRSVAGRALGLKAGVGGQPRTNQASQAPGALRWAPHQRVSGQSHLPGRPLRRPLPQRQRWHQRVLRFAAAKAEWCASGVALITCGRYRTADRPGDPRRAAYSLAVRETLGGGEIFFSWGFPRQKDFSWRFFFFPPNKSTEQPCALATIALKAHLQVRPGGN